MDLYKISSEALYKSSYASLKLKNVVFLLVYKLSIHEGFELLKHVGPLMRWFNSNISHRSFMFLLEKNILKFPSNKMLSY